MGGHLQERLQTQGFYEERRARLLFAQAPPAQLTRWRFVGALPGRGVHLTCIWCPHCAIVRHARGVVLGVQVVEAVH